MIGAKTLASAVIMTATVAVFWWAFGPDALLDKEASTLFAVGFFATVAGTVLARFWRLDRRSTYYFRYSYHERQWEDESDLLGLGAHRLSTGENEGDALDFAPIVHYAAYIGAAFLVGLATIDGRALALLAGFPTAVSTAGTQFCPDLEAEEEEEEEENIPGCALIRRAYALGYAKSLGSCETTKKKEGPTEICMLRQHDEPLFHYGWRLLSDFWTQVEARASSDYVDELTDAFFSKLEHAEELVAAQRHTIGTGPRASHHIWTNLPDPRGPFYAKTGDTFGPGQCVERYRRLPHRPQLGEYEVDNASRMLDHVLGKLLFEPRYLPPAGYCREYHVHWGSSLDACDLLVGEPETFLAETGALGDVRAVIERYELGLKLERDVASDEAERTAFSPTTRDGRQEGTIPLSALPLQRFVSLHCFVEEERPHPARSTRALSLAGHQLAAEEIRVPRASNRASAHVDRYGYLSALLVKGFYYGGLMSRASADPDSTDYWRQAPFAGKSFLISKLDLLEDMDIFLGHTWILEREDLRELYPYHVHLQNYIEVFRRQYRIERGRI